MRTSDPLLKTRQVAGALGVSVSTIKRWVDLGELAATRTVGKHRLIPLSNALRFAHRQNLPVGALLALGPEEAERSPRIIDLEPLVDELVAALDAGRGRRAKSLVRAAFASGIGAAAIGDQFIRPVLERIGHGWEVGAPRRLPGT